VVGEFGGVEVVPAMRREGGRGLVEKGEYVGRQRGDELLFGS
jgi:hypothetical protein